MQASQQASNHAIKQAKASKKVRTVRTVSKNRKLVRKEASN